VALADERPLPVHANALGADTHPRVSGRHLVLRGSAEVDSGAHVQPVHDEDPVEPGWVSGSHDVEPGPVLCGGTRHHRPVPVDAGRGPNRWFVRAGYALEDELLDDTAMPLGDLLRRSCEGPAPAPGMRSE